MSRLTRMFFMAVLFAASSSAFAELLPRTNLKVMPLGDSITAGYFTTGGYRPELQSLLTGGGFTFDFVGRSTDQSGAMSDPEHEGYSGYTIRLIADEAAGAFAAGFDPDVVLLFAGSNDVRTNGGNDQASHPDYWATAPDRLDALIQQISVAKPDVAIIVGNLMPFTGAWAPDAPRADAFNATLPGIIASHQALGHNVSLADFRSVVLPGDLSDGLHPAVSGYEKMAGVWFDAIEVAEVPSPASGVLLAPAAVTLLRRRRVAR